MARKKKTESVDDLIKAPVVEQKEQQKAEEKPVVEKIETEESQTVQEPVPEIGEEKLKEQTVVEEQKEVETVQEENKATLPEVPVSSAEKKEEIVAEVEEKDSDVEEFSDIDIPQELLAEQEKIQQELDAETQFQKEKFGKPDLDEDTMSFEDFQKTTNVEENKNINKPYLIPLSKDPNCKYSVGLDTKQGRHRVIAHKLSKEKAERYIENFLRTNK